MLTLFNGFDRTLSNELRRMDRMFPDLDVFRPAPTRASAFPRVDIVETEHALELSAEVPGFSAEDVKISLHEGVLTLSGSVEHSAEKKDEEGHKVLHRERSKLAFSRSFRLEADLDQDAATAAVKDGVLTLTLPKVAASQPKQIAVSSD